jgi:flagellar biosynthesis protein FlhB
MADAPTDQDRSEAATPFKLEEARRRGQVFKSPELNSLAVLGICLLAMLAFGEWAFLKTMTLGQHILNEAGRGELTIAHVSALLRWIAEQAIFILSPLLVLVMIVGVVTNLLQTGPVFSFYPLKPDFSRLNPVQGLKRLFSVRALYEGVKTLIKLAMLGAIVYWVVRDSLGVLVGLLDRSLRSYPNLLLHRVASELFLLLLGFLAIALLDVSFSRWEFLKKMRMSRRELRDEVKRREGDPQVRAKRRELQRALRKKSGSVSKVKEADLLITNPTHLAVALKYARGEMPAPKVISKGSGEMALKMRGLAHRYGVTVVEDPVLARRLFRQVELDEYIPEDAYPAVAMILRRIAAQRAFRNQ